MAASKEHPMYFMMGWAWFKADGENFFIKLTSDNEEGYEWANIPVLEFERVFNEYMSGCKNITIKLAEHE